MSLMDDLIGGSESTSKTYLDENQLPYLQEMWGGAKNLYNSGRSTVADLSPQMQQYLQQAMGFGANMQGQADSAFGMAGNFGNTANMGSDYLGQVMSAGGFNAPMQNGVNMDTVNSLVDNDLLNSQISASTRDIYRDLNENQMTGIASNSVGTGNAGSTRRGVAEAIAQRGADDRASDVAAGIRSNAYNQAVGVAANQAQANQGAQMGTNSLNAGTAQGMFGTGGSLWNSGMGTGYNLGAGGVGMMGQGANAMQNYLQQLQMDPWTKLSMFQGAIGNPINQSTSTSSSSGGILPAVGSLATGVGGFMQGWNS